MIGLIYGGAEGGRYSESDEETYEPFDDSAYHKKDDADFEANIDKEVELAGLERNEENVVDKNKKKEKQLELAEDELMTDNLPPIRRDDDDDTTPEWPVFNSETGMDDPQFEKGMFFKDNKIFKTTVRAHGVKHGRQLEMYKNEALNVGFIYTSPCSWKIYALKCKERTHYKSKNVQGCIHAQESTK